MAGTALLPLKCTQNPGTFFPVFPLFVFELSYHGFVETPYKFFPCGPTLALQQNREMLDPDKFCSLCHSTFNDPAMAQQHYMGKRHRKQETKLKLMAHYGRLADPAVSELPGERARSHADLDQGLSTRIPWATYACTVSCIF